MPKKFDLSGRKEKKQDNKKRLFRGGRKPDRNEKFQRSFTPLTKQPIELLEIIMKRFLTTYNLPHIVMCE